MLIHFVMTIYFLQSNSNKTTQVSDYHVMPIQPKFLQAIFVTAPAAVYQSLKNTYSDFYQLKQFHDTKTATSTRT